MIHSGASASGSLLRTANFDSRNTNADGRSIVPDPGVVIYEFTGAMITQTGTAASSAPPLGNDQHVADPVNLSTGLFVYTKTDLFVPDVLPLSFSRTYRVNDSRSRSFGIGASDSFDIYLIGDTRPWTYQELVLPDGGRVHFDRISTGTDFSNALYLHSAANTGFYGATIMLNTSVVPNEWILTLKDGTGYHFPENDNGTNPLCGAVSQVTDRYGNTITV